MCGIIGLIKTKPLAEYYSKNFKNFFKDGLIISQKRGIDATGVFTVPFIKDGGYIQTIKEAIPASTFVQRQQFENLMLDFSKYESIVGHVRAATWGTKEKSHQDAHPFRRGDITLVHNGTITNPYDLIDHNNNYNVDSETIAYSLNKYGIQETVNRMQGNYSLVWYDRRNKSLNFLRNNGKPLIFAVTKPQETLLFASELPMLWWLAETNNIKIDTYFTNKPYNLFTFKDGNFEWKEIKKEYKPIVPYSYPSKNKSSYDKKIEKANKEHRQQIRSNKKDCKKEILKKFNLTLGMWIPVYYTQFIAYRQKNTKQDVRGTMIGIMCDNPYAEAACYNVLRQKVNSLTKEDFDNENMCLFGKVVNVSEKQDEMNVDNKDIRNKYRIVITDLRVKHQDWNIHVNKSLVVDNDNDEETEVAERTLNFFPEETFSEDTYNEILNEYLVGPGGILMNKVDWRKLVKNGCCLCGDVIYEDDDAELGWFGNEEPICPVCIKEPGSEEFIDYWPIN